MEKTRLTSYLLLLLVIGVWGFLINSVLGNWTPIAEAQTRKAASSAAGQTGGKQYAVAAIDKSGQLIFGGDGTIVLNATGLQAVMAAAPRQGWKVHSVIYSGFDYNKGWTVVLEK